MFIVASEKRESSAILVTEVETCARPSLGRGREEGVSSEGRGRREEAGEGREERGGRREERGGRRKDGGGRREEAGERREEAGERRKEEGGRREESGGGSEGRRGMVWEDGSGERGVGEGRRDRWWP